MLDEKSFLALFRRLAQIDLFGTAPPAPPWGEADPTVDSVARAIDPAIHTLPLAFTDAYTAPLQEHMSHVLSELRGDDAMVESIGGALYDHVVPEIDPHLHRFLAVISNLYRSFLSAGRRVSAGFPVLEEQLPPLAMFQHEGTFGPFTLPVDATKGLFGASVGVVSLPATYADHPLLWASLAHETGGHDVLHADEELLPELGAGVRSFFGAQSVPSNGSLSLGSFLGLLWSFWMDEAASDVYGVMNIGPTFGLNLAAFFAALEERANPTGTPTLRVSSGPDARGVLDPHPTDILRLDLIAGATLALSGLGAARGAEFVADLEQLRALCAPGEGTISIQGLLPTGPGVGIPIQTQIPIAPMQAAARQVGNYIASANLAALSGRCIQDLETWDDTDEDASRRIADAMGADRSVVGAGDDAALLAGATLSAMSDPDAYGTVTARLNEALDASFESDPYWGTAMRDPIFLRTAATPIEFEAYISVG